MTAEKKSTPAAAPPSRPAATSGTTTTGRKPWVRRSPVEVVLEQIHRQEKRVAEMREELNREERELVKMQKAKDVLEGK